MLPPPLHLLALLLNPLPTTSAIDRRKPLIPCSSAEGTSPEHAANCACALEIWAAIPDSEPLLPIQFLRTEDDLESYDATYFPGTGWGVVLDEVDEGEEEEGYQDEEEEEDDDDDDDEEESIAEEEEDDEEKIAEERRAWITQVTDPDSVHGQLRARSQAHSVKEGDRWDGYEGLDALELGGMHTARARARKMLRCAREGGSLLLCLQRQERGEGEIGMLGSQEEMRRGRERESGEVDGV